MSNPKCEAYFKQWNAMRFWVGYYLNRLTDEQLAQKFVAGKHHGIWVLGHLIASDDDFADYMGKGDYLYPDYREIFIGGKPVLPVNKLPPAATLREQWEAVCSKNEKIYQSLTYAELSEPHTRVKDPEKDFFKNKEGIIVNWIAHQIHHSGQFATIYYQVKQAQEA